MKDIIEGMNVQPRSKLVIAIETLLPGGAELFASRLAEGMSRYYDVSLYVLYSDKIAPEILQPKKSFQLHVFESPFDKLTRLLDRGLAKLKIDFQCRDYLVIRWIKKKLGVEKPSVIHTNQFKVDYIFCRANQRLNIRHLITVHGDYLNFYQQVVNRKSQKQNYLKKVRLVLSSVDGVAYISDHQKHFFEHTIGIANVRSKSYKIYNGYPSFEHRRHDKGNGTNQCFVFGMVARAIPEKGWEILIKSFIRLNRENSRLILVGNGDYLQHLKQKYNHPGILFAGYSKDPLSWVSQFDVGILPTTYPSESLPTTIIEYLLLGKPVISTDIGEISKMMGIPDEPAGILLNIQDGKVNEASLTVAMETLMDNTNLYDRLSISARKNASAFDMDTCILKYLKLYSG